LILVHAFSVCFVLLLTCCLCSGCDVSAVSSSAARCLARETQMRQLTSASDADVRVTPQSTEVTPASNITHLLESARSIQDCSQPQPRQPATVMNSAQSQVITEALAVVTGKLTWATDELRRASSIETSCQLCMLIRSCADAMQALQRVNDI